MLLAWNDNCPLRRPRKLLHTGHGCAAASHFGGYMRILSAAVLAATIMVPFQSAEAGSNRKGTQAMDLDPTGRGAIGGIGIESRDIDAMADQVMRELMSRADIVGSPKPPRVVVDSEKISNNSSQRIDRSMIADALRASLNRAAAGRIRFISRESMDIIQRERTLKDAGQVDAGTRGRTQAVAGLDFTLIGRLTSLDSMDSRSGLVQRRTQVLFELVDMETGEIPWSGQPYIILRAAGDDVVYR